MEHIRVDFGLIAGVFWALILFGVGYNALVGWLERRKYAEGYMSLIVAAGVVVTLVGIAILSIEAALYALGAFAASGTPMILGSIIRHVRARERAQRAMQDETQHDNPTA